MEDIIKLIEQAVEDNKDITIIQSVPGAIKNGLNDINIQKGKKR